VWVMEENWDAFKEPIKATFDGAAPNQWPKDFRPQFLKPTGGAIGPFERSYPLTADGKVVAVETPGHVPGHCSVIVFGDDATYFLTGDATYGQEYLDGELTDGVNTTPVQAVETLRKIKKLAKEMPLVVLPAHDGECKNRLWGNVVYVPSEGPEI
jgi:glyoxylase-like metal-dependent hydrolase (beta-lactamase superfamily II)